MPHASCAALTETDPLCTVCTVCSLYAKVLLLDETLGDLPEKGAHYAHYAHSGRKLFRPCFPALSARSGCSRG